MIFTELNVIDTWPPLLHHQKDGDYLIYSMLSLSIHVFYGVI